ncbi:hypothetical protein [Asanoa sp. NPDC050611]|uniref:hypothetical protein n=1 Tax=Asanoa sp. NPDC050611 TaxID=3157098 RepID=UPI0034070145
MVHWDWSVAEPMARGVSFPAADYDAEVARVALDHSWETPERTAGRLVLTALDRDRLAAHGLRPSWVGNHHRDPEQFRVVLTIGDDYQIFVSAPWRGRSPEDLSDRVSAELARPPREWQATWHAIPSTLHEPPSIAGRRWRRQPI